MSSKDFIHDLVNAMSIGHGKHNRVIRKSDTLSKEEILESVQKAVDGLNAAFKLIDAEKERMMDNE